ncbi:hypothetical protein MNQ95_09340 [Pseudoxanthomonas daejeonensis]|uniref:hypothetical protein n=1 Tax=Pseudoxanthomonas daejeonensis TaxID=266062 RepID=UPI001F540F21|nr:hypothetical protein [Pseudoxanthomonas daejeonensis]UNK56375.1 hypothetical protein MNQ95_09340 [Pseudoxanthomonas daejeonensis]
MTPSTPTKTLQRTSIHRRAPMLALLLLLLAGLPRAEAGQLWRSKSPVELEIVDRDGGQVLPRYPHRGQSWVPGEPGQAYAVRLRNRSSARVLAVLSVDGINAVDGRTAGVHQAGYVLGPWQDLEVAGWRKSLDAVAQFVFVDPAASYAARTGRPSNLGVIGIAVFRERLSDPAPSAGIAREAQDTDAASGKARASTSSGTAPASAGEHARSEGSSRAMPIPYPQASLGTGHGEIEGSRAYYASFRRQSAPVQVSELRYDTPGALLARGIDVRPHYPQHPYASDRPRAFPGDFVPDPR